MSTFKKKWTPKRKIIALACGCLVMLVFYSIMRVRSARDFEEGRMDLIWAGYGIQEFYTTHKKLPPSYKDVQRAAERIKKHSVRSTEIVWEVESSKPLPQGGDARIYSLLMSCRSPGGQYVVETVTNPFEYE